MASPSGFNSFASPTPSPFPRSHGPSAPAGSLHYGLFQQGQPMSQGNTPTPAIDSQLNMTPSRHSECHMYPVPWIIINLILWVALPPVSFSFPPPGQPQAPQTDASTYDSRPGLQDGMVEHEVNPNFIEALSHSMGFAEADEEYRRGLQTFPRVRRALRPPH